MNAVETLRIEIEQSPQKSVQAISLIAEALRTYCKIVTPGIEPFKFAHIRLALDESLLNAFEHGCRHNKSEPVIVTVKISQRVFEVTVQDPGNGFHHHSVKLNSSRDFEKLLSRNLQKAKGWGLAIIRAVSGGLYWNDRGNRITMLFTR